MFERVRILLVLAIAIFAMTPAYAQEDQSDQGWQFSIAPYGWFADSSGSQTILGFNAPVDLDFFDDVSDNIDQAFQFHFEARKDRWGVILDPTYLSVKTQGSLLGQPSETDAKTVLVDIKFAYTLGDPLDVLVGIRYYESDLAARLPTIGVPSAPIVSVAQDESWTDIVAGARYRWDVSQNWSVLAEGDFGGLGIGNGSDLSWNLSLVATRSFTDHMSLAIGYRILDVEYDEGGGNRAFEYDIKSNGPLIGFNYEF